jgi:phage FluMu gp28-like protein
MFTPEQRIAFCDAYIQVQESPIKLDRWQELYISDTSRFSITLKCRQVGFSFGTALKGLIKALDPDRKGYTRQYVSYGLDDAIEKIRCAEMLYDSIPKRIQKKIVTRNKTMLEFKDNGGKTTSRLISIPCRSPRGRSGDVAFDEFAIYKKSLSRTIYTAALPVLSRGGCMEIGSTPLGLIGMFPEIWHDKKNFSNFSRLTVPWYESSVLCINVEEAAKNGVENMDTQERVEKFGKEDFKNIFLSMFLEDFRQEYECCFVDSAESYITYELIYENTPGAREGDWQISDDIPSDNELDDIEIRAFKSVDDTIAEYNPKKHGDQLYLGYDIARKRDAAVIFIIGILPNGKKVSVANIEMVNQPFEYQRDQIRRLMRSGLPIARGCIDATGVGADTTETLQREFTTAVLEGIIFNIQSKDALARGIKEGLEKREFILQNDNKFHRQIHSIKRMPIAGNAFRYDSERDEMGHADSFWAWALANYAIPKQNAKKGFYEQHRDKRNAEMSAMQSDIVDNPAVEAPRRGRTANQVMKKMGLR